jgi:hypothetical protein
MTFIAGSLIGGVITISTMPIPGPHNDCNVYKVAKKSVTAYVLKPPPSPPADPIIVKEKCPQVTPVTENVTQEQVAKEDDSKSTKRYHRRHRIRRYWR